MRVLFVTELSIYPPLGIMYLSSMLKRNGHYTRLVNMDYINIKNALYEQHFDIVAFSISSVLYWESLRICQKIKREFDVYIIYGGAHPTVSPEMFAYDVIDAVCIGEGEEALLDLVQKLDEGREIKNILNFWLRINGRFYKNSVRPLIKDLDSLPFPDRELIKNDSPNSSDIQPIITSRGCSYGCSFCLQPFYRQLYKDHNCRIRQRSIDNVIAELKYIKENFQARLILFYDSTFNLNPQWVSRFCDRYIKEKINIPFVCQLRIDAISLENIRYLKDAGCRLVGIGIESGNEYVRNVIFKKRISNSQIGRAIEIMKKIKLDFYTNNIIGLPWLPVEYDYQTLRLNIRYKPSFANVNFPQPYPKTELFYIFVKKYNLENNFFMNLLKNNALFVNTRYLFNHKKKKEKRKIENLHHLFPIIIRFPVLLSVVPLLISIPLGKFYLLLFKLITGDFEYRLVSIEKRRVRILIRRLVASSKRILNEIQRASKIHYF